MSRSNSLALIRTARGSWRWPGKGVFAKQQRLSQRPLAECPAATLPKRLRPYLLTFDADGKPTGLHADRYEFWLYRQVRKRFKSGELYLDDSLQHRCISPTSWSRWMRRPPCWRRWTSRSCGSRSMPSSMRCGRTARTVAGLQPRAEAGQADAPRIRQDTQKLTWRKPKARTRRRARRRSTSNCRSATWPTCSASSTASASSCRR
jgi:hypothetical protein